MVLNYWMYKVRTLNIKAADGLLFYMNEDDKVDIEFVLKNIQWKNKTIAEVIVHPAIDTDCEYFGRITDQRIKEYELVSDPNVRPLIEENGYALINFGNI